MPFVRHIALLLNISIPLYFFYYQLVHFDKKQDEEDDQIDYDDLLKHILISSLVLISPLLHVLALVHPSYCYNGHCPAPLHCTTKQQDQTSNKYNKFKDSNFKDQASNQSRSPRNYRPHKFEQENDDFIKESNSSSKDQNFRHFGTHKKEENNSGLILRLQKIQSPSPYEKYGIQEEDNHQKDEAQEMNQNTNVNEFSNIPFFRNSRRSLSNVGNTDSPRISRKSLTQLQNVLVQPLLNLTPRKIPSNPQPTPKKLVSSNFSSQNTQSLPRLAIQCEFCQECQIPKYLRMKHCFRCQKCVHKYDHHCVLLDICIGQANQKYYIAFLYANLYNTLIVLGCLLKLIKEDVFLDETTGIEHLENGYTLKAGCIIILLLNLALTSYLVIMHTRFFFNGSTTYEKERRQAINFFRYIKKNFYMIEALRDFDQEDLQTYHPFDQGCFKNPWKILTASKKPYDWQLPFKEFNTIIELKEKKESAKKLYQEFNGQVHYVGRQWGEESESSNNLHAGKTTKSRESGIRKSKEDEEKAFDKLFDRR